MQCDLWSQYIKVRKLFKGGNYSRKYGICHLDITGVQMYKDTFNGIFYKISVKWIGVGPARDAVVTR